MSVDHPAVLRAALVLSACGVLTSMLGCTASGPSERAEAPQARAGQLVEEPTPSRGDRPVLLTSAAERAPGTELAFFDELETRPLAAQDDAIHATLLLATGSSGANPRQRLQLAQALNYLPTYSVRPSREAVTVGEVSQLFAAVLVGRRQKSAEDAVGLMVAKGVLKSPIPSFQGMTGAQLVTMIGAARDAMQAAGVARVPLPSVSATDVPAAGAEQASESGSARSPRWTEGAQVRPVQEATVDPSKPSNP